VTVTTRTLATRAASGTASWVGARVTGRSEARRDRRWQRTNHRGEPVTLWEGPATVAGLCAGLVIAVDLPWRLRLGGVAAVSTAGGVGLYDDLHGATSTKGLAGHLGALARGKVTSGGVKIVGLSLAGLLAAGSARPGADLGERLAAAALVAGTANLVNLFDLRPGRALKVVALVAAPAQLATSSAGSVLTAPLGASLAVAGADLGERTMLGDCGANALGVCVGTAAAVGMPRRGIFWALAAVVTLTVLSERVSFSRVIDATPPLRWLDRLGRHPVQ
jgi:UDP-N-acetylmuramyl pentapeptide phosphotransferase/UDP-N-acetylglucosamine-1-phosphate transferase